MGSNAVRTLCERMFDEPKSTRKAPTDTEAGP
jgi:hypothetical protein